MSRSGYSDDCEGWDLIRWRGAVASAICGKRGQAFLREMIDAMDAMENKRLIAEDLVREGEVCALGVVAVRRGIPTEGLDPYDRNAIAAALGIPRALASEIMYENDEIVDFDGSPERRFWVVRRWAEKNLK